MGETGAASAMGAMRARVAGLLAANMERGALWRELEALAYQPHFDATSDVWAPALFTRDPLFFEPFLVRHLHDDDEATIRALLPRIEAAGQNALFTSLYRKIADEESWNQDVFVLAQEIESDQALEQALTLRELGREEASLGEETALALYRRNPARFSAYVRDHIHHSWSNDSSYTQLRAEARVRGDEDLYWALFRELAGMHKWDEWHAALNELLKDEVPPEAIGDELNRRHISNAWNLDAAVLAPFVARYGAAVLPYIQEHHSSFTSASLAALLPELKAHEDEAGYWRAFWVVGNSVQWNHALDELLGQPLDDAELRTAMVKRTPPPDGPEGWGLFPRTAEALYMRSPALARPLIERYCDEVSVRLFELVDQRRDDDLLDYLTYRLLQAMTMPLYSAYPTPSQLRWQKPDEKARVRIEEVGALLTGRFDRLAAGALADYTLHAANTLAWFQQTELWPFRRSLAHNPVHRYLFTRHRGAWLRSPEAMRELLESPNAHVRLIGLVFLNEGGTDAARRAGENVGLLRAVLLDRSRRGAKRLALAALEHAGRADAEVAARVLPILEGAMHFQARHAIDERAMVGYVRLRHAMTAQVAGDTSGE